MTDKPPRPRLGLHEIIQEHPIRLERIPGLGTCPACAKLIEMNLSAADDTIGRALCPHCGAPLFLKVPSPIR